MHNKQDSCLEYAPGISGGKADIWRRESLKLLERKLEAHVFVVFVW